MVCAKPLTTPKLLTIAVQLTDMEPFCPMLSKMTINFTYNFMLIKSLCHARDLHENNKQKCAKDECLNENLFSSHS